MSAKGPVYVAFIQRDQAVHTKQLYRPLGQQFGGIVRLDGERRLVHPKTLCVVRQPSEHFLDPLVCVAYQPSVIPLLNGVVQSIRELGCHGE